MDFYLGWKEYKNGFGRVDRDLWLGLDKIHRLTSQSCNVLRVDLEDFAQATAYAVYDHSEIIQVGVSQLKFDV